MHIRMKLAAFLKSKQTGGRKICYDRIYMEREGYKLSPLGQCPDNWQEVSVGSEEVEESVIHQLVSQLYKIS